MNCPYCGTKLEYLDDVSRYTCPLECVVKWSIEEMYEALTDEKEMLLDENQRMQRTVKRIDRNTARERASTTVEIGELRAALQHFADVGNWAPARDERGWFFLTWDPISDLPDDPQKYAQNILEEYK